MLLLDGIREKKRKKNFLIITCWGQYTRAKDSLSLSSLGWSVTGVAVAAIVAVVGWYQRKEKKRKKKNILSDNSALGSIC